MLSDFALGFCSASLSPALLSPHTPAGAFWIAFPILWGFFCFFFFFFFGEPFNFSVTYIENNVCIELNYES